MTNPICPQFILDKAHCNTPAHAPDAWHSLELLHVLIKQNAGDLPRHCRLNVPIRLHHQVAAVSNPELFMKLCRNNAERALAIWKLYLLGRRVHRGSRHKAVQCSASSAHNRHPAPSTSQTPSHLHYVAASTSKCSYDALIILWRLHILLESVECNVLSPPHGPSIHCPTTSVRARLSPRKPY